MIKPPAVESLVFRATARMLQWLLVLLFALLVPTVGASLAREFIPGLAPAQPTVPSIPELGWTTDGSRLAPPVTVLLGKLPSPGPNQKRAGTCDPRAAQVEINGGCWVRTETPRPCPEGVQWEHDGRCWLPVAPAARMPTSGDSYPVNVAGP